MVCSRKCEIPGMSRGSGFRLWETQVSYKEWASFPMKTELKTVFSDPWVWNEVINSPETLSSFLGNKINVLLIEILGIINWFKLQIFFLREISSLPTKNIKQNNRKQIKKLKQNTHTEHTNTHINLTLPLHPWFGLALFQSLSLVLCEYYYALEVGKVKGGSNPMSNYTQNKKIFSYSSGQRFSHWMGWWEGQHIRIPGGVRGRRPVGDFCLSKSIED